MACFTKVCVAGLCVFVCTTALLTSAICLAACSSKKGITGENEYSRNAREAYEEALDALDDGYYKEAISGFNKVKNRYPYSNYAVLAELKIADSYYQQDSFLEAAESYRMFAKLHPNSEHVPYALYRTGLSFYEEKPSDFFLFPPPQEKDLTPVRKAIQAFNEYLARFPNDTNAADARQKIHECRTLLTEHELFVARFYEKRDDYGAAIGRYEGVLRHFPDLDLARDVYLDLSELYRETGDMLKARDTLKEAVKRYPGSKIAVSAEKMLNKLPDQPVSGTSQVEPDVSKGGGPS